jgi:type IV pilus assembly protein PilM
MANGIGVTIGSQTVRALEVRRKGAAWQVTRALAAPLTAGDDAGRVSQARAALSSLGASGRTVLGLSGKDLIVRYTRAPRVPDWRLEMLMRFEIEEVAEQSGGDVAAAWALLSLPAAAGEDDTVLVALARNAHLRPRLDALAGARLSTLGGCPRSIGLYHAFVTNCAVPPGEVTMLLHLGAENTDVAVQRDGALIFARNMAGGGKPFTDALAASFHVPAETAERMKVQKGNVTPKQKARYGDSTEEKVANALLPVAGNVVAAVHSSMMFCKAQTKLTDLRVDRVLVCGAGARLRGMVDYLKSGLGVPVEAFDPFESVDVSALPADQQAVLTEDGPSMAAALGLAQMAADPAAFRLEILPEADRKKRHFVQHTSWLIASGVVAVAGLFFLYSTRGAQEVLAQDNMKKMTAALDEAGRKKKDGEQKRANVARALRRVDLLQSEIPLGPVFARVLDTVQEAVDAKREFEALHFPVVRAQLLQREVPEKYLKPAESEAGADEPEENKDGDEGKKESGGDSRRKKPAAEEEDTGPVIARIPVISLEGIIQVRELAPDRVYSLFTQELQDRVSRDLPGVGLQLQGGLEGKTGRFKIEISWYEGFQPMEEK